MWSLVTIALWVPRQIVHAIKFMFEHLIRFTLTIFGSISSKGWGLFVQFCNFLAKALGAVPVIGKFFAWLFGIPSRLQWPEWVQRLTVVRQAYQAIQ